MIGRLLGLAGSLLLYFALATLIAEAVMVGYFWSAWGMDRARLIQILAIAQGVDQFALKSDGQPTPDEPPAEQPSYQQIVEARALKFRDLELREQGVKAALDQLRLQEQSLAEQKARWEQQRAEYQTRLASLQKAAESEGIEQNRGILARLPPKQAKEVVLQMLKKNETNDAVLLLRDMADAGRAKILKEFKTAEEQEKLDELLRLIRQGAPEAALANTAQQQVDQSRASSPAGP